MVKVSETTDGINNSNLSFIVSHTTDDLIFQWLPLDKTPLAVDDGIQLPQLELINNKTGDCTSVYSTGRCFIINLVCCHISVCYAFYYFVTNHIKIIFNIF